MKAYFILLILLIDCGFSYSQNWPVVIGDNIHLLSYGITEDYDNGLLLSCYVLQNSTTTKQGILYKIDINGNILWQKCFGTGDYRFNLWKVKKADDNNTLLCGSTAQYDNINYDPLFLKLDPCGEIEWCTIIHDETISWDNYGTGIIELSDGSAVGMVRYYGNQDQGFRISLVKLNSYGEPVWIQHLAQDDSTVYNEEGYDLILTSDSNYLVAGHRNGGSQPYFIMCDSMGNEEWALSWNKEEISSGSVDEVIEKDSGVFYASGGGSTIGFPINPFFLKFDKQGNELYHKFIIGDTVEGSGAGPMEVLDDTTLAIGVQWRVDPVPTGDGYSEVFVTDTLGNVKNRRLLVEQNRTPTNIIKTIDDKIVVTGHYFLDGNWDVYLWKMNSLLEDDSLYTQPMVYDSLCPYEIVSDTIDLDCGLYVDINEIPTREEYENPLKVYPNPAGKQIHVKVERSKGKVIKVYDSYGRKKIELPIPGTEELNLDISSWEKGLYLFSLFEQGSFIKSAKVIVK